MLQASAETVVAKNLAILNSAIVFLLVLVVVVSGCSIKGLLGRSGHTNPESDSDVER